MLEVKTTIESVAGFRVAGIAAGIKKQDKLDFSLIVSDVPCTVGAVFTTNQVKAAPLLVNMEHLEQRSNHGMRAVATNTGYANACTGELGKENARRTAEMVAHSLGCATNAVLVQSTGVIGPQLPMDRIEAAVDMAAQALDGDWETTARAIMTTDTRPKMASVCVIKADGRSYQIAGIAKGAGMIAPNMATMLSIIVTDAALSTEFTQQSLSDVTKLSYNSIVVDGDTSTNDTVLLLANGASAVGLDTEDDCEQFQQALEAVAVALAQAIVRDGEGVTKFITVNVQGAPDDAGAHQIANTIANSPLVKTAFYGNDANWGRILMAAGRAGIDFAQDCVALWIAPGQDMSGSLQLVAKGMVQDYDEAEATAIISQPEVSILLDCGAGTGKSTVWTCDLSHEYVSINADYRT